MFLSTLRLCALRLCALRLSTLRLRARLLQPLCVAFVASACLAGCGQDKTYDPTANWSAERLYKDAKGDLDSGNWSAAIKSLQRLESRFPFGRYAQQAQLDMAYASFRAGERPEALASVDRFIRLNPTHERLDYAYYLKGLINFNSRDSFIARLAGQDLSERDQQSAREAWDAFRQVATRFPGSPHAAEAVERMNYLVNAMASGQVHIARYYFKRGAYVAAVNRAQTVVEQYPRTPAVRDALDLMASSYQKLGLDELHDDTRRVIERTYAARAPGAEPLMQSPQQMPEAPELKGREPRAIPIDQIPNATDRPGAAATRGAESPPRLPTNPLGADSTMRY